MKDETPKPPITDVQLVLKYKAAGWEDQRIADKMGVSLAVVAACLEEITAAQKINGQDELVQQFTILCYQYQLVGESLKIIGRALANTMTSAEVRALVTADPSLKLLLNSAIILRPFIPKDPAESMKESLKAQAEGN